VQNFKLQNAEGKRFALCIVHFALCTLHSALQEPLGGEIASRLAYTQKSEGQNLPERPFWLE